jgi:hypothetical protein
VTHRCIHRQADDLLQVLLERNSPRRPIIVGHRTREPGWLSKLQAAWKAGKSLPATATRVAH